MDAILTQQGVIDRISDVSTQLPVTWELSIVETINDSRGQKVYTITYSYMPGTFNPKPHDHFVINYPTMPDVQWITGEFIMHYSSGEYVGTYIDILTDHNSGGFMLDGNILRLVPDHIHKTSSITLGTILSSNGQTTEYTWLNGNLNNVVAGDFLKIRRSNGPDYTAILNDWNSYDNTTNGIYGHIWGIITDYDNIQTIHLENSSIGPNYKTCTITNYTPAPKTVNIATTTYMGNVDYVISYNISTDYNTKLSKVAANDKIIFPVNEFPEPMEMTVLSNNFSSSQYVIRGLGFNRTYTFIITIFFYVDKTPTIQLSQILSHKEIVQLIERLS